MRGEVYRKDGIIIGKFVCVHSVAVFCRILKKLNLNIFILKTRKYIFLNFIIIYN